MQFKPLANLVKTLRGWLHLDIGNQSSGGQTSFEVCHPKQLLATFRKLEKRRVFAVDAFINFGALDIEITGVGQTSANLLTLGTDFFVDNNNNQSFEAGELRGAISTLQSVHVHSSDTIGKFFWSGDFSSAPLANPLGTGDVVLVEGIADVEMRANFEAAGNVSIEVFDSIRFDSKVLVQGNLAANTINSLAISDGSSALITVTGDASFQTNVNLTLADESSSSWQIDGLTKIVCLADVELGLIGKWDSSTLDANANNLSVIDQSAISFKAIQSVGQFHVIANGTITDEIGANIDVVGTTSLTGTRIDLADFASDQINVSGNVSFVATSGSVSIQAAGDVRLGAFTASGTSIQLFEDADTSLSSIHSSGAFSATSSGSISTVLGSDIQVDSMSLEASDFILLADDANDTVSVTGQAFLVATNSIEVAAPGRSNFGSIGLSGNQVVIYEDSETQLDGSQVGTLFLQTRNLLTQSGMNTGAGTTALRATGSVDVSLLGSVGSIDLYRASSNPTTTISDGRLLDNRIDGLFTADGIHGDFRLRNTSAAASIGALRGSFDDLTLWFTRSSILLLNQEYNVRGNLELIAGVDVQNPVPLSSSPIDPIFNTPANITDLGARVTVGGDVHVLASEAITLNDSSGESLSALGGSTSVLSFDGPIDLGRNGAMQLAQLGIFAKNELTGGMSNAFVQLASSVAITNPIMPSPDGRELEFAANQLTLQVNGNLTDTPNTQLILASNLSATATGDLALANSRSDLVQVGGTTNLTAGSGSIALGSAGKVLLNDVNLAASHGNIMVGGLGHTELGLINARAVNVAIHEDTAMVIRSAIADDQLVLSSGHSIRNTVPFDSRGSLGISAKSLETDAGTFAHLGPISVDRLSASVQANHALADSNLFALNTLADRSGQAYLDAIGQNLPPGVRPIDSLLSGETISQLRAKASFVQSFGDQYGLFVQNNKALTVESVNAVGDGVHVLIETARGTDLTLQGTVHQQYTHSDPGGVVLIAGNHLALGAGAELRIEHVSLDVATSRAIKQTNLIASAFDGGRGPFGYESTRDVLYAADAFANTSTQNTLQRVATQFGVAGEAGFQTLIQYADGSAQLFDQNQELGRSLQSNATANTRSGVVPAFVATAGDVAGVERKMPFADEFLGRFQTLPTTAIFRRSAEFFLFEQSGVVDATLAKVDLTPVVDTVSDVFSPGRKISFSLPTEIIVTPAILVAPIRIAPEGATPFAITTIDVEPSVLSDGKVEVFIVNVGFDDTNRDGQASDLELPTRDQIQLEAVVEPSETKDSSLSPNEPTRTRRTNLSPGEPNVASKDVKGSEVPSTDQIQTWMEEYRDNLKKPSGAYAIIAVDNIQGAKVLKVFGVRDFEIAKPEETTQVGPEDMAPAKPEANSKEEPTDADKTSSILAPDAAPIEATPNSHESLNSLAIGLTAGTLWTVSGNGPNRYGRIARSIRAMSRKRLEGDNGQV
jgi:hypothetical protein